MTRTVGRGVKVTLTPSKGTQHSISPDVAGTVAPQLWPAQSPRPPPCPRDWNGVLVERDLCRPSDAYEDQQEAAAILKHSGYRVPRVIYGINDMFLQYVEGGQRVK